MSADVTRSRMLTTLAGVYSLFGWLNKGHVSPHPPPDLLLHVKDVNVSVKEAVHRP